jgi:O-antigen ligase
LVLYVLAGRWNVERLFGREYVDLDYLPLEAASFSPYEIRLLLVVALALAALLDRRHRSTSGPGYGGGVFIFVLSAFFLYLLAGICWAPVSSFALLKAREMIMVIIPSAVMYHVVTSPQGPAVRDRFWICLAALTGFLALIALGKAAYYGPERLAILGGGPNVFGRMMGLLCIGSLFFWRRNGNWLYVASSGISIILIILSGSRGGLVAIAAAVLTFFVVERIKMLRLAGIVLGACVVMGLVFSFTEVGSKAVQVYEKRVNQLLLKKRYTAGRTELYKRAWNLGRENPVVGAGLASFRGLRYGVYPHNIFLEVFCEAGVVGILLLLAVFWRFGLIYRARRKNADGATMAAFVLILASSQFSGDFYDSRALYLFMLMALVPKEPARSPAPI